MDKIKQLLLSKDYDFLRNNERLKDKIVLLTIGGSHAYGTNIESSDVDIRGIFEPTKAEMLVNSNFKEEIMDFKTDTTIYNLKKVITLLKKGNPNILEILGTTDDMIFEISKEGKMLKDNLYLFLSKEIRKPFLGYATDQLRRLQCALARDEFSQSEKEKHILGSIQHQLFHLQTYYSSFNNEEVKLYIDKSKKEDLDNEIFIDINLKHYPLRDFKNIQSEMNNVIKDYSKLNHRNNKKDDAHLNKHAMHLVRLLLMAKEIFETGQVNTYRKNDINLLMSIRNGYYQKEDRTFKDEFFEMVDDLESDMKKSLAVSILPDQIDDNKVEQLTIDIIESLLSK